MSRKRVATVLNIGGAVLMLIGVAQALENDGDMSGALTSILAGSTCFGVARYLERRQDVPMNRNRLA